MRSLNKIERIKKDILGKQYSLSIAFVSEKKSGEVNKKYRKKDSATNVLSFALRKNEGELLLCRALIEKEAKNFDKTYREWLLFLIIHGMLHLKGMKHSSTMKKAEEKYCEKYNEKYFSRNRRRHRDDTRRGGRVRKGRKNPQNYWHRRK